MKRLILALAASTAVVAAFAYNKAFYVKQGDDYTKYSFGVAGDLNFSNNGQTLTVSGYDEAIDLNDIDCIVFNAPVVRGGLTPAQQKERLLQIGREVAAKIDPNDNPELLRMIERFFNDGPMAGMSEDVDAVANYHVPQEYWDVHHEFAPAMGALRSLMGGNPAAVRSLTARAVNLYKAEDYFGIYTANDHTCSWERTAPADYLEIRFTARQGGVYSVRLSAGSAYTEWNTKDFNGRMPRKMTLVFSKDDATLAKATINTTLVQDNRIDMDVEVVANNYKATDMLRANNIGIRDRAEVTVKGEYLASVESHIAGHNLMKYDEIFSAAEEAMHRHDQQGNCIDGDPTQLLAHFTHGWSKTDLLHKVQFNGKARGFTKMYNSLSEDSELYYNIDMGNGFKLYCNGKILSHNSDYSQVVVSEQESSIVDRQARVLADFTDVSFSYDQERKVRGYMGMERLTESESYQPWYPQFSDPNCSYMEAYTVVAGHLVSLYRGSSMGVGPNGEPILVWEPWQYRVSSPTGESYTVEVPESQLVFPAMVVRESYTVTPLMVFPDMTSFVFEDFFDENSFSGLVDDYNTIVDTYLTLTGQQRYEK